MPDLSVWNFDDATSMPTTTLDGVFASSWTRDDGLDTGTSSPGYSSDPVGRLSGAGGDLKGRFTLNAVEGTLNVTGLRWKAARGGSSGPRGIAWEYSIDGGNTWAQIFQVNDIPSVRPTWTDWDLDLSSVAALQDVSSVVLRLVGTVDQSFQSIEFDGVSVVGELVSTGPAPTQWSVIENGLRLPINLLGLVQNGILVPIRFLAHGLPEQVTFTGKPMASVGASWLGADWESTPGNRGNQLLASRLGVSSHDIIAVSGDTIGDQASRMMSSDVWNPGRGEFVLTGENLTDLKDAETTQKERALMNHYRALFAVLHHTRHIPHTQFSFNGTWLSNTGQKSSRSGTNREARSGSGTATVWVDTPGVYYLGTVGLTGSLVGGSITVSQDGVELGKIDTHLQHVVTSGGNLLDASEYGPMVLRLEVAQAGRLTFTFSDEGRANARAYIDGLYRVRENLGPWTLVNKVPQIPNSTFNKPVLKAYINDVIIPQMVSEFGARLFVVDPNVGWNVSTMVGPDGIHPTDLGQEHLADIWEAAVLALTPTPGVTPDPDPVPDPDQTTPTISDEVDFSAFAYSPDTTAAWRTNVAGERYTDVVDATATMTFDISQAGGQVTIISKAPADNRGIVGIAINGGTEVLLDLYSTQPYQTAPATDIWTSQPLSVGSYSLVFRVTGTKNPAISGTPWHTISGAKLTGGVFT